MVDMAFPGFYRVFVSTTGLESFSLRPEKFPPKRFSFGGGRIRFFSSLKMEDLFATGAQRGFFSVRTPKGAYSTRGRSRHLLETPFSEPLLRTLFLL